MASPLIEAMNLSKVYGPEFTPFGLVKRLVKAGFSALGREGTRAVENLSFSVESGGVCGFLGPNGAGKTTTLKMLSGLLRPSQGQVRLFGKDPSREWNSIFQKTGGLIDKPNLYDNFSGRVNLRLKSILYNHPVDDNFDRILTEFGLLEAADRPVSTYSTGMKQRLAIAAAMVHEPQLLFLDEPSRGLDPKGQSEIRKILMRIRDRGKTTIFISSHMLYEVEQICDKVVIIDKGEHLYSGDVKSLQKAEDRCRLVTSSAKQAKAVLSKSKAVASFESVDEGRETSFTIELKGNGNIDLVKELVEGKVVIREFAPLRNSLEEFFLKVTSKKEVADESH